MVINLGKPYSFEAQIQDVKQVNPLFSECKVRVLYTGKNRNLTIINKNVVERALPTLKNIPIVGEYSEEKNDFKGHGGKIDIDTLKYVHTTKPYGVVPESATYEWESIGDKEYLTISGCYLWTGRYQEALEVIKKGKGQSMEIEILDGFWNEAEEAYQIESFIFSALCILGDDHEPAFEEARIFAYSKDEFKKEFFQMLKELKYSLENDKEVKEDMPKEIEKCGKCDNGEECICAKEGNFEVQNGKGIEISSNGETLVVNNGEITFKDSKFENKAEEVKDQVESQEQPKQPAEEPVNHEPKDEGKLEDQSAVEGNKEEEPKDEAVFQEEFEKLQKELEDAKNTINNLTKELDELRQFKLNVEKQQHEAKVKDLMEKFQLDESDIEGLDIHAYSLEQIEEKFYAIVGKKAIQSNNKFEKKKEETGVLRIPTLYGEEDAGSEENIYERFVKKYRKK